MSPLKIKIPSKNMREKPTNATIIHPFCSFNHEFFKITIYLEYHLAPTCFGASAAPS
jgi:hypothetical protein